MCKIEVIGWRRNKVVSLVNCWPRISTRQEVDAVLSIWEVFLKIDIMWHVKFHRVKKMQNANIRTLFRDKNSTFDSLIGVKAEVRLTKHSIFDIAMGLRVNEFLFDPKTTNSEMPHFLKSTTMCMFTGYHGKLSDIRSGNVNFHALLFRSCKHLY